MDQEKTLATLEKLSHQFPEGSEEEFAITRGAEAIAFIWKHQINEEFSAFLKMFHADATEEQIAFFRKNGWIE